MSAVVKSSARTVTRYVVNPLRETVETTWRSSSVVEQGTHKPLVGGSNPPSATSFQNLTFRAVAHPLAGASHRQPQRLLPAGSPKGSAGRNGGQRYTRSMATRGVACPIRRLPR